MGRLQRYLKKQRRRIDRALVRTPHHKDFSAALYAQYRAVLPRINFYAKGKVIDVGCGRQPFRDILPKRVIAYHTLDIEEEDLALTYVGDLQRMDKIASSSYDTVMCFEVLEHLPCPMQALKEIHRILKTEGFLLLTVPHLSRLHDMPHDYYRYTEYGMRYLLEQVGFEVVELEAKAGFCSFLGHQFSTFLLTMTWGIPLLQQLSWWANKWLLTRACYGLDRALDSGGVFALGYVIVARKLCSEQRCA